MREKIAVFCGIIRDCDFRPIFTKKAGLHVFHCICVALHLYLIITLSPALALPLVFAIGSALKLGNAAPSATCVPVELSLFQALLETMSGRNS